MSENALREFWGEFCVSFACVCVCLSIHFRSHSRLDFRVCEIEFAVIQFAGFTIGEIDWHRLAVCNGRFDCRSPFLSWGRKADLWYSLGAEFPGRPGKFELHKVKGVQIDDTEDVKNVMKSDILPGQYFGNLLSDIWAGQMAKLHQVPDELVQYVRKHDETLKISRRLGIVRLGLVKMRQEDPKASPLAIQVSQSDARMAERHIPREKDYTRMRS